MANSAHDIRKSANGKYFICKRCGTNDVSRDSSAFTKACLADLYENRIHPSHRMKFTPNRNRPDAPDIRTCTSCEKTSNTIDSFFSSPCLVKK